MDTTLIVNFYNNLLTIEIMTFGIIIAAIFVFMQIVYSHFSYREVYIIFRNKLLITYLIISTLTLLFTASGSLFLSFPQHNYFPQINFNLNETFRNEFAGLGILALFLISIVLFIITIFNNIKFIRPTKIAFLIGEKVKPEQIRDFLIAKYDIPSPDARSFILRLYDKIPINVSYYRLGFEEENKEISEEEKENIEREKANIEKQIELNRERYEYIKNKASDARNPLEPLDNLIIKSINTIDLITLNEACSVLSVISQNFIEFYSDDDSEGRNEWNPYSGIIQKYLKHLIESFNVYFDLCDRQRLDVAKPIIIELSKNVILKILKRNNILEIKIILSFWKGIADNSIGKSIQIFNNCIEYYRDLGDYAFDNGIDENIQWLDEIFRHLGWLAERLLSKQGIEEKPLMANDYYYNEYDQLFNALISFSYEYYNKYPMSYPLIYFDAIHVLFLQLIIIYKKSEKTDIANNIFDCIYIYYSFAKEAILKGNADGAALAILRLNECYEKLVDDNLEESAKEVIKLLVSLGGISAGNKDKQLHTRLIDGPIEVYLMNIIENSPFQIEIENRIREVYIKSEGDHKAIWEFIITLGKRMGTNFGFMFDWVTGERFAEDDPRRR
jgi:hypothetical protein